MTRTRPRARSDFHWFCRVNTQWKDIDIYGHVNNAVHFTWFDTAVNGWLVARGLLDPLRGEAVGLVVHTSCEYFDEVVFPDIVTCGLCVSRVGKTSVTYEISLFRNERDRSFAHGTFVHAYVDRVTRRPVPLSGQLQHAAHRIQGGTTG
ncbi:thioesterase [Burkholderia sp. SFA1]|uniref:acyl-CoA thioesterase n=1 Tax=Caballeronia sp. CLC5 TaxID=2906764 RepID=UPI001F2ECEDF|nr:thioesterase family protein [Caballeronia sp. CLC5]MCE4573567.1 acyl-CoA thioesterase [Caballeronia sp. CLC5]BBQ00411.1 thioesterase [Burkholderia sp. SFA1]